MINIPILILVSIKVVVFFKVLEYMVPNSQVIICDVYHLYAEVWQEPHLSLYPYYYYFITGNYSNNYGCLHFYGLL